MRQTLHESKIRVIACTASSGAPACRSNSDIRFAGACQKRTCSLRSVRRMTAGSRECNSFSACPRSNAVHSWVSVSSPVSVGPGSRAELCLPLFAITRSLVCSSAVFRGAGRGAADDELLLLVVVLAAGSAGSLAGAGSASALSGSGALGGIFPTVSFDSATLGTRLMSLAGSSPIRVMSRISGTLHSPFVNVCPSSCRLLPCKHAGQVMFIGTSSGNLHSTGTRVCLGCTRVQFRLHAWQVTSIGYDIGLRCSIST